MTESIKNLLAKPVKLIEFYGLTLTVVEYKKQHYVQIKPISDMLGLTWKHTRRNLFTDENMALLGAKQLNMRPLNEFLGEVDENSPSYEGEKSVRHLPVYIQLDRVHLYLARVNTAKVRAMGKESVADWLLALQKEWANVLYQYESGYSVQKHNAEKSLKDLMIMRDKAIGDEKARLTAMIDTALTAMGSPKPQKSQGDLFE